MNTLLENIKSAYENKQSLTKLGKQLHIDRHKLGIVAKQNGYNFSKFKGNKIDKYRMVGKSFGQLTVLEYAGRDDRGALWKCKCNCGNIKIISSGSLNKSRSGAKSCGCLQKRRGNKSLYWKGIGELSSYRWSQIMYAAKRRDIPFHLTLQDGYDIFTSQNKKCALSGQLLTLDDSCKDKFKNASLDRIDSTKPYEKTNVQWVSKAVNLMKHAFKTNEFIDVCKQIVKYNEK
jgi:hypothetical protein